MDQDILVVLVKLVVDAHVGLLEQSLGQADVLVLVSVEESRMLPEG